MELAFGFGNPVEWAIIFTVALILFGPKKLPEIGRQLGHAIREFRKITDEVTGATQSVREEIESIYRPALTENTTSSPTVEKVMSEGASAGLEDADTAKQGGSEPRPIDLKKKNGLTLSTLPPAGDETPKGH